MEIILSNQAKSIKGTLGKNYGYHIQRRKNHFYGVRFSNGDVPPDGHLRFIFACAELARTGLHICNVKLGAVELHAALTQARKYQAAQQVQHNAEKKGKLVYNAQDIINLKITFGL